MINTHRFKLCVVSTTITICLFGAVQADASSANISHTYKTDGSVAVGSLVSLNSKQTDYITPASSANGSKLLGVVVKAGDSLLAVNDSTAGVQVATSGTASTLVSTVNGSIKVGDQIAVSPFKGVGQRAAPGMPIIGLAQTAFSDKTSGAEQRTITDVQGKSDRVSVGFIRVNIGVASSSAAGLDELNGLQKISRSLTGHTVSTPRIILSIFITLVTGIAIVTLMYTSIYGGIISIGRNPLAKIAVMRTLVIVLSMALGMGAVATVAVFLLLR